MEFVGAEGCLLVFLVAKCIFSAVWSVETLLHLFLLGLPVGPLANMLVDLAIIVVGVLPLAFCLSVDGPLPRGAFSGCYENGSECGVEVAAVVGLFLLEYVYTRILLSVSTNDRVDGHE